MKIFTLTMLAALVATAAAGAEEGVAENKPWLPPPPPPSEAKDAPTQDPVKEQKWRENRRLMQATWRAFGALDQASRAELMKLQANDPEAFRARMNKLGSERMAKENANIDELRRLAASYKAAGDDEKQRIKTRIGEIVRAQYFERLEENRRQLEETKKRAARIEAELNLRSAKADETIAALIDTIVSTGDLPQPPHRQQKPRR